MGYDVLRCYGNEDLGEWYDVVFKTLKVEQYLWKYKRAESSINLGKTKQKK